MIYVLTKFAASSILKDGRNMVSWLQIFFDSFHRLCHFSCLSVTWFYPIREDIPRY